MQRKILIADDDQINITLMGEMLGIHNYQISRASNGEECIEIAEREQPELIILDWKMPRMDGLEALKALKNKPETHEIPVLMVTGVMNSPENLVTAMDEGAVDFLRKPFDRLELRARVRNMLMLSDSVKELKEKFRIINQSNNLIKSLFQGVPHPLVYYSTAGMIQKCNQAFIELTGENDNNIYGKMIYHFFSGDMSKFHLEQDLELIKSGDQLSYEGKVTNDHREYIFSKHLLSDESGEPTGIICVITEVTELKYAHASLLESKKRELVSSTLRLININEINNNLISELRLLQQHVDDNGKRMIRSIINKNSITAAEGVWQDFETRFENVYESFYNRLNERFPDLTPGEKKLCALLRLNISSKDIAAITLQNPQSVDMARYRLRKKLNLKPEDNLVDFLLKIDQ